jgi:O-antigen/teichoic acid export membrane protein
LLVTCVAGALLFDRTGSLPRSAWAGPWLILVVMTAFNLYCSPMLAVMEGCGRVGQVARLRLVQSMIGYGLTWIALFAGGGLWAIPLSTATAGLCTAYWLRLDTSLLRQFESSAAIPVERAIDWRREVLPFQWRIAVSWISGYLIFQLFTPLIFVNLGPVAAGRLGIASAIFNALMSVGVSWINAKIPSLTAHITRGERDQLNRSFATVASRSIGFTTLSSALVVVVVYVLGALGVHHVDRIADLPTLVCIAVTTSATTVIYAAASYIRAHREEAMLSVSVVSGLATLAAAYFASRHGTLLTMLLQACVTIFISLPWTLKLFQQYHRRSAP